MEAAALSHTDHYNQSYDAEYEHYYEEHGPGTSVAAAGASTAQHQHPSTATGSTMEQHHQLEQGQLAGDSLAPLLLVTTVDIGDGKTDRIEVRQGDVPLEVASNFVSKHGLPTAVVPRLAMHLEENLHKVESSRRAAGCESHDGEDDDGLAVFHRLYQQAVALRHKMAMRRDNVIKDELDSLAQHKTNMSWISSEMMRDRSAGPFGNYGEMLYAESLESLARKRDRAQRVKAQREAEEVAGVTFHPAISRHAQTIWGPHEVGSVPAWQRLSRVKMTKAQERLEMLRREKEEAEVRECTFKPAISGRSERLMTERSQTLRSLNVSAHQQLYQDAIRRQQKQQDYQHWYPEEVTFQPKLNESAMSKEFLRKSLQKEGASINPHASGEERHMALVNRLYASYEKLQHKLSEARSTLCNSIDPNTGKRLFHPETGRAPRFSRNTSHQPVSEYLYSLSQQQDEKHKAAAAERERKQKEEAGSSKAASGSSKLVRQLQHKRFKQIFDFLDVDGLGSIDLVALMGEAHEWLDDLDDEVRADLESASRLLQKRALKHVDSNNSTASGSTIFMPPPPGRDFAGATSISSDPAAAAAASDSSLPPTPTSCAARTVVTLNSFCQLMEEVLGARRGPRAYLAPSPPKKQLPTETYAPKINQRSKQLANRVRRKDASVYEVLYQENSIQSQKLSEKRAQQEAERSKQCTFAPRLVSAQLVKEGRVMKAVREGSWWRGETDSQFCELEGVASLQQLAASVMGDGEEDEREAGEGVGPESPAAAAEEGEQHDAGEQQQQEGGELQQAQAAGSPVRPLDGFSSAEEAAQYLELEREVAEMQAMLEEATAAAERGTQSTSDQQYLSEILGLAQEQVDAMAPAISQLQSLDHRPSPSPSRGPSCISEKASPSASPPSPTPATTADGAAAATGLRRPGPPAPAAAAAAADMHTRVPLSSSSSSTHMSSFRVTDEAAEAGASAGSAAADAAAAAAAGGVSLSGASPGQLQYAVTAALQELSSASDADFVAKALALSKVAAAGGFSSSGTAAANSSTSSRGNSFIAAGKGSRGSSKLHGLNMEGADLFELAAGAGGGGDGDLSAPDSQQQQQRVSGHDVALESLEELAAAMAGILGDNRP